MKKDRINRFATLVTQTIFTLSLVGLLLTYHRLFGSVSFDCRVGILVIAIFAVFFLIFALVQEYRFSHKARYAEGLHYIHQIYHCNLGKIKNPRLTQTTILEHGKEICDLLAAAFGMITGTRCSASLKVFDQPKNEKSHIAVSTLCRDAASRERQSHGHRVFHRLDKNTDFLEIFSNIDRPQGRVFFDNDLPARHGYSNSSFEVYGEPKEVPIRFIRGLVRNSTWTLPYKSTIVAAIYPFIPTQDDALVGFLCVDSSSRGVFWKRYDIDLVCNIAVTLYPLILKWTEIVGKKKGGEENV